MTYEGTPSILTKKDAKIIKKLFKDTGLYNREIALQQYDKVKSKALREHEAIYNETNEEKD